MTIAQRILNFLFGWKYYRFFYFASDKDDQPLLTWVQRSSRDGKTEYLDMSASPIVMTLLSRESGYYTYSELK